MKNILILLALTLCQWAQAGDASVFESLGFSKGGKYYAYLQDGIHDGSGAYWMELGIVDVARNTYVARKTLVQGDPEGEVISEEVLMAKYLTQLKKDLSFDSYGFSKKPLEHNLISREPEDLSQYSNTVFTLEYWPQGGAHASFQTYELLLNEVPAPITKDNDGCDWVGNSMIELKLNKKYFNEDESDQIVDLQIDTKQPKVRSCSSEYSIDYVMYHKDSISVVLRYSRVGFEGPDNRYMVVTGQL